MYGCADLYSFNRLGPLYGRLICYGSLLRVYRMCISGGIMIIIFFFGVFWQFLGCLFGNWIVL
jgi:hypothetical protein